VWKAIENIPLDCDIDFFFRDKAQLEEYLRKLKSIPYVYHIVTEKTNKYNTTFGFHIYERDYNKTVTVQFISCRFCDSLEKLLSGFDFTACQFGFNGSHLIVGDTSFDDLKSRTIRFNDVRNTTATAIHLKKYLDRGFKLPPDQAKKLEDLLRALANKPKTLGEIIDGRTLDDDEGYPSPEEVRPSGLTNYDLTSRWGVPVPSEQPTPVPEEPGLIYAPYISINTGDSISTTQWSANIVSNANTIISNTTESW